MKNRLIYLGLFVSVLLLMTGCHAEIQEAGNPFAFYYQSAEPQFRTQDGALGYEIRDVDLEQTSLEELLKLYLAGPSSEDLTSPFPKVLPVEKRSVENGTLYLTLGDEFSSLKGIHLSVATACINQTFLQLEQIQSVMIATPSGMISSQERNPLGQENFLFFDESASLFDETIHLYYSDVNGQYLIEEQRTEQFVCKEDIPRYVLQQLISGPSTTAARPALPQDTQLLSLKLEDGICTVSLSQEFYDNRPVTTEEALVALYSIVNSLTSLEDIEGVRILVDGDLLEQYGTITVPEILYFTKSIVSG